MAKIEEMSFTIDKTKCIYKVYEYKEQVMKPIAHKLGEIPHHEKVEVTKYAIHEEFYKNEELILESMICEIEKYATILTIMKDILQQHVAYIEKMQRP